MTRDLFRTNCVLLLAAWLTASEHAAGQQPPAVTGIVGNAVATLATPDGSLPGWLYYGVNAADRGLGYNGSYLTLGGYFPSLQDDLGGLWAADIRGHVSEFGGFFSNVGAVRKQFLGGTLLGLGIYWDYDGDLNQYPTNDAPGTQQFGQFGHTYNQVGVSGEWLTNYGNLRSNGYIPVGSTAHTIGSPGNPFVGNWLLCQTGLDAALGGADLEVGLYVPALADWAGMVSVGGYALGNGRYTWAHGSDAGADVVPWFGGVYTRLDMTFAENWDFSLQANNDSYFDWTGFARLTFRMGGSRRRNVPDQMEQPMMRNEHIVRAHQTPVVAINPETGDPWRVIHVDNRAPLSGATGTATNPLKTLATAQSKANQPYDIVYVRASDRAYESNWQFQADNQILIGQGSTLAINTASCGYRQFFHAPSDPAYPVLTSDGTAVTLRNGVIVDHFRIENAPIGISADASVTDTANVNDVQFAGTGTAGDAGVLLTALPTGAKVNLFNMNLENMDLGLLVDQGAADIIFQGLIANNGSSNPSLSILNTTGGTIDVNRTTKSLETRYARNETFVTPFGIVDESSQFATPVNVAFTTDTDVNIGVTRIIAPSQVGALVAGNSNSEITFTDLRITDAGDQAFLTQANDVASRVTVNGASRLSSVSTTLAAFESNDDASLAIDLVSLESAVAAGTNGAIVLQGTSTGFLTISESFLVSNPAPPPAPPVVPGSVVADVTNTTPVVVTAP